MNRILVADYRETQGSIAPPRRGLSVFLHSGRPIYVVMPLVFLPWLAIVLCAAGGVAALNFIAYASVVFAAGYGIAFIALPSPARTQAIFLAPAVGILAVSALTALWVRLGNPLVWSTAFWLVLTAVGALGFWKDRILLTQKTVSYGLTLAIFSLLISGFYFLPSARNDAVQRSDGSFSWMFRDTQYYHSMAASIKDGGSPPRSPGTYTAELLYHFGSYAPAAAISRLDGLNLGDAYARVTRGASLWALLLSCFGLGTLLSIKATGKEFGGIMSVAGLFFYGSLLTLFTPEWDNTGHMIHPYLFLIPGVEVTGGGGPFGYLLAGHSIVHGLVAITGIMGLCLIESERQSSFSWRGVTLLALPALLVSVNSVAAMYCIGVAGILLFWGRLAQIWSWPPIMLMACLFLGAWKIMGYSHAPDMAEATINHHVTWEWWTLAVWFIVGLGFRISGFGWISRPFKEPLSAMVLASVLGLLAFSLLLQLRDGNERYGINFLQSMFSIFAFSRLTPGCWRGAERFKIIAGWLRPAKAGLIVIIAGGVLIACVALLTHQRTGTALFGPKLFLVFLLLLLLVAISKLMNRSRRFAAIGSAVLMAVLLTGFLAWIPDEIRHGMGEVKTGITYPPEEVRGLRRLSNLMPAGERFATNKHALDSIGPQPPVERSYGYAALAERPVLLEGYLERENAVPWFGTLLHDNDSLFTTTDPATLRNIAKTWGVQWLVARPGTDISLPRPLPSWLTEQQNTGSLKIYRIN